jgi:DNA-binding response OmpR family regulator
LLNLLKKTLSVEAILNYLWLDDENNAPDIANLKNIISRLRKKIPTIDIENVYGFGYRINLNYTK